MSDTATAYNTAFTSGSSSSTPKNGSTFYSQYITPITSHVTDKVKREKLLKNIVKIILAGLVVVGVLTLLSYISTYMGWKIGFKAGETRQAAVDGTAPADVKGATAGSASASSASSTSKNTQTIKVGDNMFITLPTDLPIGKPIQVKVDAPYVGEATNVSPAVSASEVPPLPPRAPTNRFFFFLSSSLSPSLISSCALLFFQNNF